MNPLVLLVDQVNQAGIAVVPVLIGPLQVLLMFLPAIALAVGGILLRLFSPKGFTALLRLIWRFKFHLLVVGAVVGGIWWGVGELRHASGGRAGAVEQATTDWSCQRGDIARTGAVAGTAAPGTGDLIWGSLRNGMREDCVMSSPAVVGNRVYVATARVAIGGGSGAIYAFDADTGGLAWRYEPDGYRPTFSSPAVSGTWLAIGEGLHTCNDARLVVLDIKDPNKPALSWTYTTSNHIESTPAIADGRVFFGAGDDGYYGFELAPGPDGKPKMLWHLVGERYRDCEVSPVVYKGKVYVGLGLEGHAIVCIDAATGKEEWRIETPAPVFGPPSIRDGRLYVGMGYGDFVNPAEHGRDGEREKMTKRGASPEAIAAFQKGFSVQGSVWCVDLDTRAVLWKAPTPKAVLAAVAVDDAGAIATAADGTILSLGHDGHELARMHAGGMVKASPAVAGGMVYVVNDQGRLIVLDRDTLRVRFDTPLGTPGGFYFSSPAIARGHLYVGTDHDGLLCVGNPLTRSDVPVWAGEQGGPGNGGSRSPAPAAKLGDMLWNLPEGQADGAKNPVLTTATPALAGGDLIVPMDGGGRRGLACLPFDPASRAVPGERWFVPTTHPVVRPTAIVGDRVLAVDGKPGDAGRSLIALGRADGKQQWKAAIDAGAGGWLWADEHDVLVESAPGRLVRLDVAGGTETWRSDCGGALAAPPSAAGALIMVAVATPPALVLLDRPTGRILWRVDLPATPTTAPALIGARILLGSSSGLIVRSVRDGAAATDWQNTDRAPVTGGGFIATPRLIAWATPEALVVADPVTGAQVARHATTLPAAPVRCRGAVLFTTAQGFMRLDEDNPAKAPVLWCDASWLGTPTTALIAGGDGVLGGFGPWGLVRLGGAK